ncbi:DNA polymerase III subunit chi [uncultured Pelagimonas sp.]|uniref:DNA polymerase III subunit chi n=1 Tax=uncultured Pelagimonas sp. TaxID=1618102 RepID=UPI00263383A9|nr:DNA polymerase III subunit chi [uncultured Pelagimonas sp.]
MGAAFFYHLTQRSLEDTLPMLLGKALGAGWKVAVRGTDPGRMDWLDQRLWLGQEDDFLPHGQIGGPHDALQPVLLTCGPEAPNAANCVMTVDGAGITADEVKALDRVCILFDGYDQEAVQNARVQWKELTGAGCSAQYWSEETGRWEKKAES